MNSDVKNVLIDRSGLCFRPSRLHIYAVDCMNMQWTKSANPLNTVQQVVELLFEFLNLLCHLGLQEYLLDDPTVVRASEEHSAIIIGARKIAANLKNSLAAQGQYICGVEVKCR